MSVSGSRPTDANNDGFEPNLGARGGQKDMDERLAELIRLIESTGGLAPAPAPTPPKRDLDPRRPPFDPAPVGMGVTIPFETDAPQAFEFRDMPLRPGGKRPTRRTSGSWMLKASALVLGASALLGAGFGIMAGKSGAPKAPPVVAAAQAPARAPQSSHERDAATGDPGAISPKDIAISPKDMEPAPAVVATSGQKPTEIESRVPPGDAPQPPAMAPGPAAPAQPANGASGGLQPPALTAAPVLADGPVPQTAVQKPDSGPAPQASPPKSAAPDATTASSAAVGPVGPAHVAEAPQRPARQAANAEGAPAAAAKRSPPKPELTMAPPKRPPVRLVVAKAEAPRAEPQPASEPQSSGATIIAPQAVAEPLPAPPAPTSILTRPLAPLQHAFKTVLGVFAPAAPAPRPAEQAAAAQSGGWAVQFAAPKTEAQASSDASRLNTKYAAALNGAKIRVQKTEANGGTVYALRASGLTRADAAALCERAKGRDCSLAK